MAKSEHAMLIQHDKSHTYRVHYFHGYEDIKANSQQCAINSFRKVLDYPIHKIERIK